MDYFHYKNDQLYCEEVSLEEIATAVGTPFYCYSERTLLRHLEAFRAAFAHVPHLICYSVKANGNLAVLEALHRHGSGFDIVSGGELARVQQIGCPANKVVYSGVGKSHAEIRAALSWGIRLFNVESLPELRRINALAGELGVKAPVALRINPDVDPKTHPYISTGLRKNKFGIPYPQAVEAYQEAARLPCLEIVGLDCHIGSQLTELAPFVDALRRVLELLAKLRKKKITIQTLDLGGGLGIPYYEDRELPPQPESYAKALLKELAGLEVTLILEPGRAIAGNAGILVTRVEYVKEGEAKRFVITDAGMNDLMRPALYNAHHTILPVVRRFDKEESVADVVGPICETGDFLARDRLLPACEEGDLLAVRSAGAYGFSMSSTYNTRPRVAEVMVRGSRFQVVRCRESVAQLLENERLFPPEEAPPP